MGFHGVDSYGATRGITAEQGALGAAQDFNTVNINDVQHRTDAAGKINTIHVDAYTRVGRRDKISLADAADKHGCTIAATTIGVDIVKRHVRRQPGNFIDPLHPACFQALATEDGYRDRGILQTLFTLSGGNGYFFH